MRRLCFIAISSLRTLLVLGSCSPTVKLSYFGLAKSSRQRGSRADAPGDVGGSVGVLSPAIFATREVKEPARYLQRRGPL